MQNVKPCGDYVLVKRLPDVAGLLWLPQRVKNELQRLKRGLVVAVGAGDPLITVKCAGCGAERQRVGLLGFGHSDFGRLPVKTGTCDACGSTSLDMTGVDCLPVVGRVPMAVAVGDEILYWRSPANDVRINGEDYVFLHEEQHLVAVLEPSAVAA